ncbi:plastocyanin/azurin family copper-binding protein [Natrinema sp. H-ect4]|uniref:cupredoxin domain-containing protein n=1 Tax=Natrinema sp. H-ect4 TaxID=3242699 RepID=UPI0035A85E58
MVDEQPLADGTGGSDLQSTHNANRRRFLAALGVGGLAATAGCAGSGGNGDDEEGNGNGNGNGEDSAMTIDTRFGRTVTADESASIDADHTVELLIQERENIPIPEFYFEPTGLYVETGDTVKFNMTTPHHNVNAYHPAFGYNQRVPDETPAYSSPILSAGDAWYYTFEQEGVHDIMCAPHELFGMVGRIVVGSASGPGANPVGDAPGNEQSRPPEYTAGTVLGDSALEAEAIVDAETVAWSEIADENKQPLLQPAEE